MKRSIWCSLAMMILLVLVVSCSQNKNKGQETSDTTKVSANAAKDDILTGELSVIVDEAALPLMLLAS
jgi:phosphate transport system substrate-binding protein